MAVEYIHFTTILSYRLTYKAKILFWIFIDFIIKNGLSILTIFFLFFSKVFKIQKTVKKKNTNKCLIKLILYNCKQQLRLLERCFNIL